MQEEMKARMYERQTDWERVRRETELARSRARDAETPPGRRTRLGDVRALLGLS